MKNKKTLQWLIAIFVITITVYSQDVYAQREAKRLPDGTVVYSDGTMRLPNGTVKYPNNTNTNGTRLPDGTVIYPNGRSDPGNYPSTRYPRTSRRQSDGSIIYPDGRIKYPDGTVRYPDGTIRYPRSGNNRNGGWIPPGQAKKRHGDHDARDWTPGHNKNRDRDYEEDDDDGNNKGWKKNKEWKNKEWKNKKGHGNNKHDD